MKRETSFESMSLSTANCSVHWDFSLLRKQKLREGGRVIACSVILFFFFFESAPAVHSSFFWRLLWDVDKLRRVAYMTEHYQTEAILTGLTTSILMMKVDKIFRSGYCLCLLEQCHKIIIIPTAYWIMYVRHKSFILIIRNPQK